MKVKKLECLVVHPGWRKNLIFVRLETDDGIVGWGEAYSQYDRDRAISAQVEELVVRTLNVPATVRDRAKLAFGR